MSASCRVRLVRADSLQAWHRAIAAAASPPDPLGARSTMVLVPTTAAAHQLRRTIEHHRIARPGAAVVLPDVLTREQWYERLRAGWRDPRRMLSPVAREVLLQAAAHEAITEGFVPPFTLRPVLVRDMLALYDELRRRQQRLDDFERLLAEHLEPRAADDRGAERMLRQTRFLAAAFRAYERRLAEAGAADEHALRDALIAARARSPYRTVVITTADAGGEPGGMWPADADLLATLDGIRAIEVLATEERLAAGVYERVHRLFPGIEEARAPSLDELDGRALLVPASGHDTLFVSRDREDELRAVVRQVKACCRAAGLDAPPLDRTGIVFRRPLPYLYLAREVFAAAQVPFQCDDTTPLAAEAPAAVLDLVLAFVETGASRQALVALLRSPHLALGDGHTVVAAAAVRALDLLLQAAGYSADASRLVALLTAWGGEDAPSNPREAAQRSQARPAVSAAAAALADLAPLFGTAPISRQLACIESFLAARGAMPVHTAGSERDRRARTAVRQILRELSEAHAKYNDVNADLSEVAALLRRWIEAQTFAPRAGRTGVQLLDATSAPYADVDALYCVGLVEGEWPDRPRRNIFYAPFLLRLLGWADDGAGASLERADFVDLLRLPRRTVTLSSFQLEEDALVAPSPLLDDVGRARLQRVAVAPDTARVFIDEALASRPVPPDVLAGEAAEWASLRLARTPADAPRFHGKALPFRPPAYAVGAVELHAQCPFRYFARYVLGLEEEEPDEEEGLNARERGRFVHEAFERFYATWQAAGHGAVTPANLEEARALFIETVEPMLATLPAADAMLERTRLLGSPVAAGLADVVLRVEAERSHAVVSRRVEDRFDRVFDLAGANGPRPVRVRGIADRIDLLEGGGFRVVDYKSSVPPAPLQLAVYAQTTAARLRESSGRDWQLVEAAYVIFGAHRGVRPLGRTADDRARHLAEATARFVAGIDAIESGAFPPRPVHQSLCNTCPYAGVCRKDHVPEADDAPPAV